ncbi:hypothetical protein EGW08_022948 [Elysia chlorotica]|uniref:SWIM-type domain-containing protein n=1 Tax=Elysia chlorotica TaxID=188477 RepID=A0A433SJL6_ELYCH|nr:hypothetical protein EGW08_022948 [Elysia chlorotica]
MRELLILLIFLAVGDGVDVRTKPAPRPTFHRCNWCGIGARCINNRFCRCLPSYIGDAYFLCWRPEQHDVCQVIDDPVLTTENNEAVSLAYLDKAYLVDKLVRGNGNRKCRIRITETRQRKKGKSLPNSIRVRLDLMKLNRNPICSLEFKLIAEANALGDLKWKIESVVTLPGGEGVTMQRKPWRVMEDIEKKEHVLFSCNCPVYFKVTKGKILQVRIPCCGHFLGFRPQVRKLGWLKAGFFLRSRKESPMTLPPGPLPETFPLCLRPGYSVSDVASRLGLTNTRHAMSYLALTNLPDEDLDGSAVRTAMVNALRTCPAPKLRTLMYAADFLYSNAPFIREASGSTPGYGNIMDLLKKAADWFCDSNVSSCQSILDTINTVARGIVSNRPSLDAFVTNNCTV